MSNFTVKVTRSKITVLYEHTHVQYQNPITFGKKVMAKVKVFQKYVKLQGQGHEVKNYGTIWTHTSAISKPYHFW